MHGRMYPINRIPHSFHIRIIKNLGFKILYEKKNFSEKANFEKLNKVFKNIFNEEDLQIKSVHIILAKP